jgi:hypothetical protein
MLRHSENESLQPNQHSLNQEEISKLSGSSSPHTRLAEILKTPPQEEHPSLGDISYAKVNSSIDGIQTAPHYITQYPESVIRALAELYTEYNQSFKEIVSKNKEAVSDYQYAFPKGDIPKNYFVQIDMQGLSTAFLQQAETASPSEVKEAIRGSIFEIENSIAAYQVLESVFAVDGNSLFRMKFRRGLDDIRREYQKPIALLAVTEEKYQGMKSFEFGKAPHEPITPDEVSALSGFDALLGPDQFRAHLRENNGVCNYLLYVRASEPISRLKNPKESEPTSLLTDPSLRAIIKANAITLNVDAPTMEADQRINDTKAYLSPMRMAFQVRAMSDIFSEQALAHQEKGKSMQGLGIAALAPHFRDYLGERGISPAEAIEGAVRLRAKPLQGTYGCYGHTRGALTDKEFRRELRVGLRDRGEYVVQPELTTPVIRDIQSSADYTYIDRNFFSFTGDTPTFLGGIRTLISTASQEAKKGRIHGNSSAIYAQIF